MQWWMVPGYTPGYDVRPSAVTTPADQLPAPSQRPQIEPVQAAPIESAPVQASVSTTSAQSAADAEAEMMNDPIKWLESLALRQGVDANQLTTNADMDYR